MEAKDCFLMGLRKKRCGANWNEGGLSKEGYGARWKLMKVVLGVVVAAAEVGQQGHHLVSGPDDLLCCKLTLGQVQSLCDAGSSSKITSTCHAAVVASGLFVVKISSQLPDDIQSYGWDVSDVDVLLGGILST
ncbi:hypothetical protein Tco_0496337 [Tanacetum coccineum]